MNKLSNCLINRILDYLTIQNQLKLGLASRALASVVDQYIASIFIRGPEMMIDVTSYSGKGHEDCNRIPLCLRYKYILNDNDGIQDIVYIYDCTCNNPCQPVTKRVPVGAPIPFDELKLKFASVPLFDMYAETHYRSCHSFYGDSIGVLVAKSFLTNVPYQFDPHAPFEKHGVPCYKCEEGDCNADEGVQENLQEELGNLFQVSDAFELGELEYCCQEFIKYFITNLNDHPECLEILIPNAKTRQELIDLTTEYGQDPPIPIQDLVIAGVVFRFSDWARIVPRRMVIFHQANQASSG